MNQQSIYCYHCHAILYPPVGHSTITCFQCQAVNAVMPPPPQQNFNQAQQNFGQVHNNVPPAWNGAPPPQPVFVPAPPRPRFSVGIIVLTVLFFWPATVIYCIVKASEQDEWDRKYGGQRW